MIAVQPCNQKPALLRKPYARSAISLVSSARREVKPYSLSYQAATDTKFESCTSVSGKSTIDECESPTMRDDVYSPQARP